MKARGKALARTSFTVPRSAARIVCVTGVVVVSVLLVLPVRASYSGDPVVRLGRLDPQLAPLSLTASCGRPLSAVEMRAASADFVDVARANACRSEARRRVAAAVGLGGVLVVGGLVGIEGARPADSAPRRRASATKAGRRTRKDDDPARPARSRPRLRRRPVSA